MKEKTTQRPKSRNHSNAIILMPDSTFDFSKVLYRVCDVRLTQFNGCRTSLLNYDKTKNLLLITSHSFICFMHKKSMLFISFWWVGKYCLKDITSHFYCCFVSTDHVNGYNNIVPLKLTILGNMSRPFRNWFVTLREIYLYLVGYSILF